MKIVLFLAVVTLGKASEILTTTSEAYTELKPLKKSSDWEQSNKHESLSSHATTNANSEYTSTGTYEVHSTSSTVQESPFKSGSPVSRHGLTTTESSFKGTGYSPVVEIGSSSSPLVKNNLFSSSDFATITDSSSDIFPIDSDAVPTTRYLTYTDPASSYSLYPKTVNSETVSKDDSLFPFGSKSVQVVSVEEDSTATSIKDTDVIGYSPTVSSQGSLVKVPSTVQNYNFVIQPKVTYTSKPLPSVDSVETTTRVPVKYSFQTKLADLSSMKYSTPSTHNAFSLTTTTPKTYTVSYNKPLITNIPEKYPSTAQVHSLPFVIKSNPVHTKYVPNVFSKPYSTASPSSLYTKVFSTNTVNTTPRTFSLFTTPTPTTSPTPHSVTATTPVLTNAVSSVNYKPTTHSSYTSITSKPYSTPASLTNSYISSHSTPDKFTSYSKAFSKPISEVTNSANLHSGLTGASHSFNKFYNPTQGLKTVTHVTSEKSSTFNPYKSLNSLSKPTYTPLSHASVSTIPPSLGISSITYPSSNTIYHSSPSIHSQQISGQSYLPIEYSVLVPFRDVNHGQHDTLLTSQQSHYSGNFPQRVEVTEKTVYSTPLPVVFSSSTPKPELNAVPAHLFTHGYSSTLNNIKSSHNFDGAPPAFAYTVQSVPLSKEYHTVESPVVRTWGPDGNWKVLPGQYFGKHFQTQIL